MYSNGSQLIQTKNCVRQLSLYEDVDFNLD